MVAAWWLADERQTTFTGGRPVIAIDASGVPWIAYRDGVRER